MKKDALKEWVQFLKSNGIVSSKIDPNNRRLRYIRPVYSADLERFLSLYISDDINLPEELWIALGLKVIKHHLSKKEIKQQADDTLTIVDDHGSELSEAEAVALIKKIVELGRGATEKARIQDLVNFKMSAVQKKIFMQHLGCHIEGKEPIEIPRVKKFLSILCAKKKPPGIFKYFPQNINTPTLHEAENRWVKNFCPLDEADLFSLGKNLGFEEARVARALNESKHYDSNDEFNIDYGEDASIRLIKEIDINLTKNQTRALRSDLNQSFNNN